MKRWFILFSLLTILLLSACGAKSNGNPLETAQNAIGKNVEELVQQIGEPEKRSYASSCLGDGEDGELYYNGFTVYTYRDADGNESIYDVVSATNP